MCGARWDLLKNEINKIYPWHRTELRCHHHPAIAPKGDELKLQATFLRSLLLLWSPKRAWDPCATIFKVSRITEKTMFIKPKTPPSNWSLDRIAEFPHVLQRTRGQTALQDSFHLASSWVCDSFLSSSGLHSNIFSWASSTVYPSLTLIHVLTLEFQEAFCFNLILWRDRERSPEYSEGKLFETVRYNLPRVPRIHERRVD